MYKMLNDTGTFERILEDALYNENENAPTLEFVPAVVYLEYSVQ